MIDINKKTITFIPSSNLTEISVDQPQPAKNFIPDWYKKIKNEYLKNPVFENGSLSNTSLKMCMPFLDSLTSGYIQKTWCDIYITKTNNGVEFSYSNGPAIIGMRSNVALDLYPEEFYPFEFIWSVEWMTKTPKEYSILVCHPFNRIDLPFYTLSGIVDSDLYHHAPNGNLPFYIKKDFEGLIPAGTPMFQILPIKRDGWKSKKESYSIEIQKRLNKQRKFFWEFYKKNMWQKKYYE